MLGLQPEHSDCQWPGHCQYQWNRLSHGDRASDSDGPYLGYDSESATGSGHYYWHY